MEFVMELLLTAFFALVFSFLVANLVSMVMGTADSPATGSTQNANSETPGEELKFDRGLKMETLESNSRTQFVPEDVKVVEKFDSGRSVSENPIAGLVDVEEIVGEKSEVPGLSAGSLGKEEEVVEAEMGCGVGFDSFGEGDVGNTVTGLDGLFVADKFEGVKEESTETVCLNAAEKIVKTEENGLEFMGSVDVVDHDEKIKVEENQGSCGIDVKEITETVCLNVIEKIVKTEENGLELMGSVDVIELGEGIKVEESEENQGVFGVDVDESTETVCLNVTEKIVKTEENCLESMGSDAVVEHLEEIKVDESGDKLGICDIEDCTETVCLNVTEKIAQTNENGAESMGSDSVDEHGEEIQIEEEHWGICGIDVGEKEKAEKLDSDEDDDWEGIERSELENLFFAASNYVLGGGNKDRLANVGSDVHMELFGLHKVAMEGPCHEPQPMALKVFARAKWVESCYV